MTPQFTEIIVPGVNFSLPEPQKRAFFSDFDSEFWKNGAFQRKVCSLEVAVNLKDLHLIFTALLVLGGALQVTRQQLFEWLQKVCTKIFGQNPAGSWNIHTFLVPTKVFRSQAFICAEKMNF
jgi:hypothetical protein